MQRACAFASAEGTVSEPATQFGLSRTIGACVSLPESVKWRDLAEFSLECLGCIDSRGKFLYLNAAGRDLFDLSREEVTGVGLWSITAEKESLPLSCLETMLHSGEMLGSVAIRRLGGERREIEYRFSPAANGVYLFSARDVTERNRLQRQVRHSERLETVGRLVNGIAHDFNNMVTVIRGYGELLAGKLGGHSPLNRYTEAIVRAADRSSALIRQLLTLGRDSGGNTEFVDMNAIIRDLQPLLERIIGEEIRVTSVLAPGLGKFEGDPTRVSQILMNLVVNAKDAMEAGGRLHLETANAVLDEQYCAFRLGTRPGPYVMLSVTDSGCGMDAETRSRIFEPFFTTKDETKGTGLGLATVQEMVKEAGGCIWLYSEPGQGSTFKIYFPRSGEVQSAVPLVGPRGRGESVLVIEDDHAGREMLSELLVENGYSVIAASGGEEALNLCESQDKRVQLVLSDVIMAGTTGQDLSAYIARRYPNAKILLMSGFPYDELVQRGFLGHSETLLQKPFQTSDLLIAINRLLVTDESRC